MANADAPRARWQPVPASLNLSAEVNRRILLDRNLHRKHILLDCAERYRSAKGVRAPCERIRAAPPPLSRVSCPAFDATQAELPLQCTTRRLRPRVVVVHARVAAIFSDQRDDDVDVVAPRCRAAVADRDPPTRRPSVGVPGKPKTFHEPLRQLTFTGRPPPPALPCATTTCNARRARRGARQPRQSDRAS